MLRMRKTPFIIALNKIDRMYDWNAQANAAARQSADQRAAFRSGPRSRPENYVRVCQRRSQCSAVLGEPRVRTFINVVPTCHYGREFQICSIPCLSTQTRLNVQLQFFNAALHCLEVKMIEGLGTTMDVILINGTLNEGQTIVVAGLEGAIVTTVARC